MSGSESGSDGEPLEQTKFETADAGASHTYPQTASGVRKGGFMVIKGRPCKASAARRRAGELECSPHSSRRLTAMRAGGGCLHVQDGQARPREVPLRGAGHLHAAQDGGARAFLA